MDVDRWADVGTSSVVWLQVCMYVYHSLLRGSMLPQDLHTLGASKTNRKLQWCVVVLIFETSIDPIITE